MSALMLPNLTHNLDRLGVIDLGVHFWILLMFELWHRSYIDTTDFLHTTTVETASR